MSTGDPIRDRTLPSGGAFVTTCWTLVIQANSDSPEGREALEVLCRIYWFPVYALVRRQGFDPESARDFTQGFFEHLLSHKGLTNIRRERGHFRSYLAQSVRNFLADAGDRARAQKRGSGATVFSLDVENAEGRYLETPPNLAPDRLFDRQWAEQLLAVARMRLEKEFAASGKANVIQVLESLGDPNGLPLTQHSQQLGMPLNTLKSHLRRARIRHAELIREVIAETVSTPVQVESELRELLAAIAD